MALREISNSVTAPKGFKASGVRARIKQAEKTDLAVIYSEHPAAAAGMFTKNVFKAPPVVLDQEKVKSGRARAIVANSGNANACTGEKGHQNARRTAQVAAQSLAISEEEVLVCSTGVIGHHLPMDKVEAGVEKAIQALSPEGGPDAARAIMTTDTKPKSIAFETEVGGVPVRIGGIAKGSGMISPKLATMLTFVTTDAAIAPEILETALQRSVEKSFNCVTVDGDMSTNDTILVLANGAAGNAEVLHTGPDLDAFQEALDAVCNHLAKEIARDGEGATKLVEIRVTGAMSYSEAKVAALAVANSPLVKTAIFGQDPNWGRVLCAIGYSGARVEPEKTDLYFGGVKIVEGGVPAGVPETEARKPMLSDELVITVDLGLGNAGARVYTCDLSYDYVKINAEYHT